MARNFGIPNATGRKIVRGDQFSGPHTAHDTQRGSHIVRGARHDSNSLAGDTPPSRFNLAVVRDGSFLQKHELNPVERLDAELDHRELAACIIFGILITVTFGLPIAMAVAFMSFG